MVPFSFSSFFFFKNLTPSPSQIGNSALDAPNNVLAYVLNSAKGNEEPNVDVAILFVDIDDCSETWVLQPHGNGLIYFGPEFAWSLPL